MRKKQYLALTLSLMLVMTFVIGAGTFALFSASKTNANNHFKAGTIDLGTNPEPMYYTAASHPRSEWMQQYDLPRAIDPYGGEAIGGWAPGDSIDREMTIINSGSLDAIVKGVHARINLSETPGGVVGLDQNHQDYQQFIDMMKVKIVDRTGGGVVLYDGSLRNLLNAESGGNGGVMFDSSQQFVVGEPRTIDFNVTMDLSADNHLQGKTWVFDFVFYAEQARNNGAPQEQYGTVQGIVTEHNTNHPLAGVQIDFGNGSTAVTDQNGQYSITLPVGTYSATASKDGYNSASVDNIVVENNQSTTQNFVLTPLVTPPADGTASGFITNALDGKGVQGLTINFRSGHNTQTGQIVASTTTGANGKYHITLPEGNYTGEVIGQGYHTTYFNIISVANVETPNQNASVTPILPEGDWKIVLTWGKDPKNLDAHLTGPKPDGSKDRFHVYFKDKEYYTGFGDRKVIRAKLDKDDKDGYGPETITITNQMDGIYRYSVHDYTNRKSSKSNALANSNATVTVYKGNQIVASFTVPNQKGTLWKVFEINGNTLTPLNQMTHWENPDTID